MLLQLTVYSCQFFFELADVRLKEDHPFGVKSSLIELHLVEVILFGILQLSIKVFHFLREVNSCVRPCLLNEKAHFCLLIISKLLDPFLLPDLFPQWIQDEKCASCSS